MVDRVTLRKLPTKYAEPRREKDAAEAVSAITTIRKRELAARLGCSAWTLDRWRKMPEQNFPSPVWLSPSMPVWRISEIEAWLDLKKGPR